MIQPGGLTIEYLSEKRVCFLEKMRSDEHYEETETIIYGNHNPFSVPVAPCDECGSKPEIHKSEGTRIKWIIMRCSRCGKQTPTPQLRPWQAALGWNEINLGTQNYRDLPLFGLSRVEPGKARSRMLGIRYNLELRSDVVGLDRIIAQKKGQRQPDKKYHERLDAYLKWSMLALRLILVDGAKKHIPLSK